MSRVVHVAVGVILDEDGNILIAKRADSAHQGGLWEFPGGKVEPHESVVDALARELHEELAIHVITTQPLIKIRHDYGDKVVLLDVHKVTHFTGVPHGNEGQPIQWVSAQQLHQFEFPAANRPIVTAIQLPQQLLITGQFSSLQDFFTRTEKALRHGIRLIQLRVNDASTISALIDGVVQLCNQYSARLQINTSPDLFSTFDHNHVGLHLNSANLLQCRSRPVAKNVLLSASCHDEFEIAHAQKIGVDFICLSPVRATNSHPNQKGMGWQAFEQRVNNITVPVFALGGMKETDLSMALASGAQGIAGISEWW